MSSWIMKILIIFYMLETLRMASAEPKIIGSTLNDLKDATLESGTIKLSASSKSVILFGIDMSQISKVRLSHEKRDYLADCGDITFPIDFSVSDSSDNRITMNFIKADILPMNKPLYLCTQNKGGISAFVHQGDSVIIELVTVNKFFPLWASIVVSIALIALSGLFSGLNLGLMSLTPRELNLIMTTGTPSERKNARAVLPLRKQGNVLLCAILFGNTIVNTTTAIILEDLTSGIMSVMLSTVAIVIFGEVIPQSICARYGLLVGARTRYFTWSVIFLTFPVCFPLGKMLDLVIGHETPIVYNRHQLLEVVRLNCEGNLEADEAGIIFGALKFKSKTVYDIMTPLSECFMVNENSILDFKTISEIVKSGYSRIPVYSETRSNIVAMLLIKDLVFIDPDDMIPLISVLSFYNHPLIKVFHDTKLDIVFKEFKNGLAHLGIVIKIRYHEGFDPTYEAIGIVTLEDIIEEIIQAEISDETDIQSVGQDKSNVEISKNLNKHHIRQFFEGPTATIPELTPNTILTICQLISTAVPAFSQDHISINILRRLISHPGVAVKRDFSENYYLYKKGVPADYFVLIIEGRVEITIGSENLTFVQGPFSYFGQTFLDQFYSQISRSNTEKSRFTFIPDFTLKILTAVVFLKINFSLFRIAVEATTLEKGRKQSGEKIDDVWDKMTIDTNQCVAGSEIAASSTEGPEIIIITNDNDPPADSTPKP